MAARAYDAAVVCLRGPNASLNFPDSPSKALPLCHSPKDVQIAAAAAAAAAEPCTPLSLPVAQPVAQSLKAQLSNMETEFSPRILAEESSSGRVAKKFEEVDVEDSVCSGESSPRNNFTSLDQVNQAWDCDMKNFFELPPLEDLLNAIDYSQYAAAVQEDYPAYRDCRSSSGPLEIYSLDQLHNRFGV